MIVTDALNHQRRIQQVLCGVATVVCGRLVATCPHAAGLQLRNNVLQVRVTSCWRRACSGWIQVERTLGDTQQLGDGGLVPLLGEW